MKNKIANAIKTTIGILYTGVGLVFFYLSGIAFMQVFITFGDTSPLTIRLALTIQMLFLFNLVLFIPWLIFRHYRENK